MKMRALHSTQDEEKYGNWENVFSGAAALSSTARGALGYVGSPTVRGVLGYAGSLEAFGPDDIAEVLASWEESGDYAEWSGCAALRLIDGRFALVSGWCDTTGWGCQDGTDAQVAATLHDLVRLAMSNEERERLGYPACVHDECIDSTSMADACASFEAKRRSEPGKSTEGEPQGDPAEGGDA